MRTVVVIALLALVVAVPRTAAGQDAVRGQAFAERNCGGCHIVGAGPQLPPRPDAASFNAIANTPGMTALAIAVWLETPHREMPHIILDRQDRDDVIAYIMSLKAR